MGSARVPRADFGVTPKSFAPCKISRVSWTLADRLCCTMKLSEMRELLAREGIQLTKSLGQNFLHDGNQLRRIVEAADLSKQDKVLEIGPGLGPLTELLLEKQVKFWPLRKTRGWRNFCRAIQTLTPSLSRIRSEQ